MRIAMPVISDEAENSKISKTFEETKYIALIDLNNDSFDVEVINNPYSELDKTCSLLKDNNVNVLIAEEIKEETCKLINENKTQILYGASGTVLQMTNEFLRILAKQRNSCSGCASDCDEEAQKECNS